jgi:anti-sigma B factor antagonist
MRSLVCNDYALDGRTHVIEVEGPVDLYAAPSLQQRANEVSDSGKTRVIVDLSSVDFIDSAGLGVLVDVLKRLRETEGSLSLVVTDYDIERLLDITGLDSSFTIFRSRDEAVEALAAAT